LKYTLYEKLHKRGQIQEDISFEEFEKVLDEVRIKKNYDEAMNRIRISMQVIAIITKIVELYITSYTK